jgi:single-strand DNA-binding protein
MAGINKVILVGNLGKDPEVRTVQSGAQVARFSLATSESYTNKEGQKVENTEWHNVVLWRGLATVAEKYLKKGNKVYIEGKLRNRQYEDKDGVKKYTTEIEATDMLLLDRPQTTGGATGGGYTNTNTTSNSYGNDSGASSNNYTGANVSNNEPPVEDDLPF